MTPTDTHSAPADDGPVAHRGSGDAADVAAVGAAGGERSSALSGSPNSGPGSMPSPPDFDRMYVEEGDPWRVATSWYEQRKIAVVLAALAEPTYDRALDPACGTGHLARALADRVGTVVARDASQPAVEIATEVCADVDNVRVERAAAPYADVDSQRFDLVVLSEFLYYLSDRDRAAVAQGLLPYLAERVEVLAVHWRERPEGGATSGEHVHAELREFFAAGGFRHQVAHFDEEFVLDAFTRGHDHHLD